MGDAGRTRQAVPRRTDRPDMIDLTGGQPDLVPEWIPWTLDALGSAGVADSVYVWSDDNLSNDYFFRYLSEDTRYRVAQHPGYGRVCCFKGFDQASFSFNTRAAPDLFDRQFELFSRLLATGMDLYAYATFTSPTPDSLPAAMTTFVDRLQRISEALPLRLIPLEISEYGPVEPRLRCRTPNINGGAAASNRCVAERTGPEIHRGRAPDTDQRS